ncbi:pyridoxamine 5'-phosphate oxidase family protein [Dyadobacter psychrotolerans]|uniref:Pyridoxamine 5'-phosphate oxidase family protein n=1 Tax=Dyadobacter psychrotolerans TaxID=2541721 RepID=A0A4R5DH53_9BACT|nr:pyridoxamine 5'-phosphate oxidase family protein [Dyadobacter psychrotolerans]TDE11250.1 pyridoxamine 5'-phosphate oxidase family protein [Dyadobacter psychrotolerans]
MATNYAAFAFGERSKALQEQQGSRGIYSRIEQQPGKGLASREVSFIRDRDSFYLASIGENAFPYIQHRGGPKGFLHVVDSETLAFADFQGNKQYISAGNALTHPEVSLFLMDYSRQIRLKIYAKAEIADAADYPDLLAEVSAEGYEHITERIILLHVLAFDWNCPKYITPRYTAEEINTVLVPLQEKIRSLEAEVSMLKKGFK